MRLRLVPLLPLRFPPLYIALTFKVPLYPSWFLLRLAEKVFFLDFDLGILIGGGRREFGGGCEFGISI